MSGNLAYTGTAMNDVIKKIKISQDFSIKEALKKIDAAGIAILFVCDENGSLLGSLTDGDIRRRILGGGDLQENITHCFNRNPYFVTRGKYVIEDIKKFMLEKIIEVVPVVDGQKRLVDILFWADLFEKELIKREKVEIPVVIMAGGKGERLGPFTNIFPKPLIPMGDKPVIEMIIDKFRLYHINRFYITLNYKGEMIKSYLDSIEKDYKIEYVWEKEFMGTVGSLKLISSLLGSAFIVSNGDIIVDVNYGDLVNFHRENKNILTVVGSIQHHKVSYGVIDFEEDGQVKKIREKPEFDITVNTGLYVLSAPAITFIPASGSFDMTELIDVLLEKGERVGVYPVSQKSYIDVGEWEEYRKAIEKIQPTK